MCGVEVCETNSEDKLSAKRVVHTEHNHEHPRLADTVLSEENLVVQSDNQSPCR